MVAGTSYEHHLIPDPAYTAERRTSKAEGRREPFTAHAPRYLFFDPRDARAFAHSSIRLAISRSCPRSVGR
jgi:hypothetical protein